ncbi:MAG: alcohol dehydrogenase catalytic domain-containing protein [Actinomycetia bacterium]|nr:alcohol dehydrogenase catalytic domain-containing protein [Actinomycetes bacterium]
MKVRAAVLHGPARELEVVNADLREPGPGEVRIRVDACGICRSDLHVAETGESIQFPAVLGHEGAGVIEEVGPGSTLTVGDHVVLSWSPRCGACPRCLEGSPNLCQRLTTSSDTGGLTLDGQALNSYMGLGCLAESVVLPQPRVVPMPADLPAEALCLIGCGVATGYGAAVRTASTGVGDRVAVFGCGAVGLSAVQGARLAGAAQVFAIDPDPIRRDLASKLGATATIDPGPPVDVTAILLDRTGGGVDVAIEATGHPDVMASLLDPVRPGGRAVVVGLPAADATIEISPFHLLYEKTLTGSIYGSVDPHIEFPVMGELYRQGRLDLDNLQGAHHSLAGVNDAFTELSEHRSPRPIVLPNRD